MQKGRSGTATPAIIDGEGVGATTEDAGAAGQEGSTSSTLVASSSTVTPPSSETGIPSEEAAPTPKKGSTSEAAAAASDGSADKPKARLKVEDQTGKILTVLTNDLAQLQKGTYFIYPRAWNLFSSILISFLPYDELTRCLTVFECARVVICAFLLYRILGWRLVVCLDSFLLVRTFNS